MSDHVALTLDGAIATTPTSAMRWVPEPEKAPESHANARWSGPGVVYQSDGERAGEGA